MSFEEFQDGRHGGHLRYRNGTILIILNLQNTLMPPNKLRSILRMVWEMSFEEFQGGHLGHRNRTILAILNLCVTMVIHIVFAPLDRVWEEMSLEEFQDGDHL